MNIDHQLLKRVASEAQQNFLTTRKQYEETGYTKTYELNEFWGGQNMDELLNVIHSDADAHEKISAIHRTYLYSVNTSDPVIKSRMIEWYLEYFQKQGISLEQMEASIAESVFSNPHNAMEINGRLLSPDFMRTLLLSLRIENTITLPSTKRFKILELGAGYGGLARTLKLRYPNTCYVIMDIPETLAFSYMFLNLNFPNKKTLYITSFDQVNENIEEYDFVFVPTMFAEAFEGQDFELFCNTASLGEMKNTVIRYWMDFIQQKANVKNIFWLNRYLNTMVPVMHDWRLQENECAVHFDNQWEILSWELEPSYSRCSYVETIVTRNLEIIAHRVTKTDPHFAQDKNKSMQLIEKVRLQDWYRHYNEDNSMFLRDHQLAPDLTMSGTLFSLWESIRLHANSTNVGLMIQYLTMLIKVKPFEEVYYYIDFQKKLIQNAVVFGASITGEICKRELTEKGYNVKCYIDNHFSGNEFQGVPVYSVNEFMKRSDDIDAVFLASSGKKNEMREQLNKTGLTKPVFDYVYIELRDHQIQQLIMDNQNQKSNLVQWVSVHQYNDPSYRIPLTNKTWR